MKVSRQVVGGTLTTGNLTSLLSYITNIMISLMLFSMVIVMISMSFSGCRRISEVLNETPDLRNPDKPVTEVADGTLTETKEKTDKWAWRHPHNADGSVTYQNAHG